MQQASAMAAAVSSSNKDQNTLSAAPQTMSHTSSPQPELRVTVAATAAASRGGTSVWGTSTGRSNGTFVALYLEVLVLVNYLF